MTRISEKMIAASTRPAKRSMGWRVKVEAISGERQQSKKSCFPLASWYSGRYRPAERRHQYNFCPRREIYSYLDASPTLEVSRLSGLQMSTISHWYGKRNPTPCCPNNQVILKRLKLVSHTSVLLYDQGPGSARFSAPKPSPRGGW
jgi:hypothetical protein